MTARTLYSLPGPLTLTPSQRNRRGRFAVTNREPADQVTIALVTGSGHDIVTLDSAGDRAEWTLDDARAVGIAAASYPALILLETTELPIGLHDNLIMGNTAADPMPIHVDGGSGGGPHLAILTSWNFTNPTGVSGHPALTIGLSTPSGPGLDYSIVIRFPSGSIAATYAWTTATNDSVLGDGTGLDVFGSQGPGLVLVDGYTYTIECTIPAFAGNLGYSLGDTVIFDVLSDWPAGVSVVSVPVAPSSGIVAEVSFLIGSFTAVVP